MFKNKIKNQFEIKFTPIALVLDQYKPQPASKFIPEWYKDMPSYFNKDTNEKSDTPIPNGITIKKCMPVFDSITSGYIIPTPVDLFVSTVNDAPWYEWPSHGFIDFHPIMQAPDHPQKNNFPYPKFINPWAIQTPPGYSCLFVSPFHRDLPFTIMPGIVDTDNYNNPVNFPFILNDTKFNGLIPAGTPMAQVIPFKRDSWSMAFGNQKDLKKINDFQQTFRSHFFNNYKNGQRSTKKYK